MEAYVPALRWFVDLLEGAGIPFQVVGGLAARIHGGRRPVDDIDPYAPEASLETLLRLAGDRLVRPPEHHRDECWDLRFLALEYDGQRVEIGIAEGARLFERSAGCWVEAGIDFGASERSLIHGIPVPVMPRSRLIDYKRRLGRDVDREDLRDLTDGS